MCTLHGFTSCKAPGREIESGRYMFLILRLSSSLHFAHQPGCPRFSLSRLHQRMFSCVCGSPCAVSSCWMRTQFSLVRHARCAVSASCWPGAMVMDGPSPWAPM